MNVDLRGAFWTPSATILSSASKMYDQIVRSIFANGEQGFAYDPNDLNTMFQDAAGTVPVTATGQPVGLMLDKSKGSTTGINLHTTATLINTTSYPATGTRSGLDITVRREASGYAGVSLGMPTVVGKVYLLELIAPDIGGFWVIVSDGETRDTVNRRMAIDSAPSNRINTKITLAFTATAPVSYIHLNRGATHNLPVTFKDVSCREVLGNRAYQTVSASRPLLQRNATTGAYYLAFDGVDDFLRTNSIDFTATDKVSLFAGLNVAVNAATGCVIEISTSATVNNGSFGLFKGPSTIQWASRGTTSVVGAQYGLPVYSDVLCAKAAINTPLLTVRRNAILNLDDKRTQGTDNYGNYPLYIGRREGLSLPFSGHLYGLIGVGRLTTDGETLAVERELAKQTGVVLNA